MHVIGQERRDCYVRARAEHCRVISSYRNKSSVVEKIFKQE